MYVYYSYQYINDLMYCKLCVLKMPIKTYNYQIKLN